MAILFGYGDHSRMLTGHVTLEVECLDRLYLNSYIRTLATPGGLVAFMRERLGKPTRRRWCWDKLTKEPLAPERRVGASGAETSLLATLP